MAISTICSCTRSPLLTPQNLCKRNISTAKSPFLGCKPISGVLLCIFCTFLAYRGEDRLASYVRVRNRSTTGTLPPFPSQVQGRHPPHLSVFTVPSQKTTKIHNLKPRGTARCLTLPPHPLSPAPSPNGRPRHDGGRRRKGRGGAGHGRERAARRGALSLIHI